MELPLPHNPLKIAAITDLTVRANTSRQIPQQAVIFVVRADPEPCDRSGGLLYAQCSVRLCNPHAPDVPKRAVQTKRWMQGPFF